MLPPLAAMLRFATCCGYDGPNVTSVTFFLTGTIMQVDEATVRRIARLARIKITGAEAKGLEAELSGILDWVKQLDEVDTANVEPMTRVVAQGMKKRKDVVTDGEIAAVVTRNAPMSEDNFFVVPKVVE